MLACGQCGKPQDVQPPAEGHSPTGNARGLQAAHPERMRMMSVIREYLAAVADAACQVDTGVLDRAIAALEEAYVTDKAVYTIGNGGSAANASHFAQDLSKGTLALDEDKRFRVLSLVDNVAFLTAIANDIAYEAVFTFQLKQFAQPGDWLVAISGSGNSANVLAAAEYAKERRIRVMAFTGFDGGRLAGLAEINVHVPCRNMCRTEAVHSVLMHMMVHILRERLAAPNAAPV